MLDDLKKSLQTESHKEKQIFSTPSWYIKFFVYFVDFTVLLIPRFIFGLIYQDYLDEKRLQFLSDIKVFENTEEKFSFFNQNHLKFFLQSNFASAIFTLIASMILIGFIYYTVMPLTKKGATIGQKAFRLQIIKNDGTKPNFFDLFARNFLSYIPWFLPIPMIAYWKKNIIVSICIMLLISFWYDLSRLIGKRLAIHDILSGTSLVNTIN